MQNVLLAEPEPVTRGFLERHLRQAVQDGRADPRRDGDKKVKIKPADPSRQSWRRPWEFVHY